MYMYSPWGCEESDTTEQLSLSLYSVYHYHGFYIHSFR